MSAVAIGVFRHGLKAALSGRISSSLRPHFPGLPKPKNRRARYNKRRSKTRGKLLHLAQFLGTTFHRSKDRRSR